MKSYKFLLSAAAAVLVVFGAQAQSLDDAIDKFNEAAELFNGRDYPAALVALQETVELGLEAGPEAMETVTDAQKLIPACYFRIGLANAQAQNWDAALENLEKASETGELYGDTKTNRDAGTMLARVYTAMAADAFNSKDYAKAAEIFAKGYEANPTDTDLGLNLAMSYAEMGETEKAYQVYNEIISLEDRHSKYKEPAATAREKVGYYKMLEASSALEAGDFDRGVEIIEGILEADPENAIASMMLIQTATNRQNWDKVIEWGEAAAQAQETPELKSDAYFLLGAAYQNKENKAKAIETYRKVTDGGNVATARAQITALSN